MILGKSSGNNDLTRIVCGVEWRDMRIGRLPPIAEVSRTFHTRQVSTVQAESDGVTGIDGTRAEGPYRNSFCVCLVWEVDSRQGLSRWAELRNCFGKPKTGSS